MSLPVLYSVSGDRQIILVTGPASSGKSEFAEAIAHQHSGLITYVATAQTNPDDPEWTAKIVRHQARRPAHWHNAHILLNLPQFLSTVSDPQHGYLIDALGTWVANGLEESSEQWEQRVADLLTAIASCPSPLIIVAEEVGWSLVPPYPAGRLFRDRLGKLTRQVGTVATQMYLVTGGYALPLHTLGLSLSLLNDDND